VPILVVGGGRRCSCCHNVPALVVASLSTLSRYSPGPVRTTRTVVCDAFTESTSAGTSQSDERQYSVLSRLLPRAPILPSATGMGERNAFRPLPLSMLWVLASPASDRDFELSSRFASYRLPLRANTHKVVLLHYKQQHDCRFSRLYGVLRT
jgi:hypothetical protein